MQAPEIHCLRWRKRALLKEMTAWNTEDRKAKYLQDASASGWHLVRPCVIVQAGIIRCQKRIENSSRIESLTFAPCARRDKASSAPPVAAGGGAHDVGVGGITLFCFLFKLHGECGMDPQCNSAQCNHWVRPGNFQPVFSLSQLPGIWIRS
jgi:hypothetical protein